MAITDGIADIAKRLFNVLKRNPSVDKPYDPERRAFLGKALRTGVYLFLGGGTIVSAINCKDGDNPPAPIIASLDVIPDRSAYASDGSSMVEMNAFLSSSGFDIEKVTFNVYKNAILVDSYEETNVTAPDGSFDMITEMYNPPAGIDSITAIVEDTAGRTDEATFTDVKRGYGAIDGTAGETGDRTGLQDYLEETLLNDFSYQLYDDGSGAGFTTTPGGETIYSLAWGLDLDGQDFCYVPNHENLTQAKKDAINGWNDSIISGAAGSLYFGISTLETPVDIEQRINDFYSAGTNAEKLAALTPNLP